MIAEYQETLFARGAWFYRRLFWETGLVGQVLYLEAEAAGVRATGIPEPQAVVRCALEDLVDGSPEARAVVGRLGVSPHLSPHLAPHPAPDDPAAAWLDALARWLRAEP